jgi:hypothetical protein
MTSNTTFVIVSQHFLMSKIYGEHRESLRTGMFAVARSQGGACRLRQGGRNTYKAEQNNALQRHWLGRFKRRSQIVPRSLDMLDKTLALLQRFRVNGTIEELLSLIR